MGAQDAPGRHGDRPGADRETTRRDDPTPNGVGSEGSSSLAAALRYAARGRPVIPVRAKVPLTAHGCRDASADADVIRAWWRRWPAAGVAIATGRASGLVVLDVDPRHGGDDSLRELAARVGGLPDTPTCLTGGGGAHHYYRHPADRDVPCRVALGGYGGLDLRGEGGYVVAPPSPHASGRAYAWDVTAHPDDVPMAPCPPGLLALAGEHRAAERVAYAPQGVGELPSDVLRLVSRSGTRLADRFTRSAHGLRDTSPSGVDASLSTCAALAGLRGPEIEAVVRESRARAGLPRRPASYYRATVGLALASAEGRGERARRLGLAIAEGL